jgi:hypothetical protein
MKPLRDPRYLAWIRTLPCVVRTRMAALGVGVKSGAG